MSSSRTGARVGWIDVAKGIAIVAVALYHAILLSRGAGLADGWWADFNDGLSTFRMPLFFLASGLVAESALRLDWTGMLRKKLVLVWAYLLWSTIRFVYFSIVPQPLNGAETSTVVKLLLAPVWPITGLWYLHALVFFFVITKLMRGRVDPRLQLAGAAVLAVVFAEDAVSLRVDNLSYVGMGRYFFFFLAGVYAREFVLAQAARTTPARLAAVAVLFVPATLAVVWLGISRVPALAFVASVLAVACGVGIARLVEPSPAGRRLATLGKNTLPIYVMHVLVIATIVVVVDALVPEANVSPVLLALVPIFAWLAGLGAALALHRVLERSAPWLFATPGWLLEGYDRLTARRVRSYDDAAVS